MATTPVPIKTATTARPASVAQPATAKTAVATPGTTTTESLSPDSSSYPAVYEAAILYAADHYDAAREVLKEHMRTKEGKGNTRTWLMLFDLLQITHNKREFDALSMMFTVQFERSPPAWSTTSGDADPRRKEKRERRDLFVMQPAIDGALLAEIDRFENFVKAMGTSRVDFGKVKTILVEEAELLSIIFERLRKAKTHLWFNSLDAFIVMLRERINEASGTELADSNGWWSLLFELTILDGRLTQYEELGLEYAIAFEISPPPWEVVVRPTSAGDDALGGTSAKPIAGAAALSAAFQMNGVISQNNREMLQQLTLFATNKQEVLVDASGLLRIDFAAAGQFFEAIRAIQSSQKRVILSNLNELVAALLEVFGMSKHAMLMRKKFN
jgi:anti-anti-sigma regulatory factor